jgi:hypothetical protein
MSARDALETRILVADAQYDIVYMNRARPVAGARSALRKEQGDLHDLAR